MLLLRFAFGVDDNLVETAIAVAMDFQVVIFDLLEDKSINFWALEKGF